MVGVSHRVEHLPSLMPPSLTMLLQPLDREIVFRIVALWPKSTQVFLSMKELVFPVTMPIVAQRRLPDRMPIVLGHFSSSSKPCEAVNKAGVMPVMKVQLFTILLSICDVPLSSQM